jgi:ribosomal 50S subunit-recycling heat shock protein
MRLDLYLSKTGLVKRRTIAKELADSGLIKVNGRKAKPSVEINVGDIIHIGGNRPATAEVKRIPSGNVKKEDRENYFTLLD